MSGKFTTNSSYSCVTKCFPLIGFLELRAFSSGAPFLILPPGKGGIIFLFYGADILGYNKILG